MVSYFKAKVAWVRGRELAFDVALAVEDGIVREIVPRRSVGSDANVIETDLLLPGFINAHSHLEYTAFRGRLPRGDAPFHEWLRAINALKREFTEDDYEESARAGIAEMLAGGATTVIDCARGEGGARALEAGQIRYFLFWEVLGLGEERAALELSQVESRLSSTATNSRSLGIGINPHAPYTVGPHLREAVRNLLASKPDLRCAWHLSETPEEMRLFAAASGAIADFLTGNSLPLPITEAADCTPVEFLRREGLIDRCDMAFHLNYPDKSDAATFAAPRAVVHCPGTHAYFAREPFPMWQLVSGGANVCLGTDSLSSGDSLSMFEMLRLTGHKFPALTGPQLLDLVTSNPARCRVLANAPAPLGIVSPGAAADFVAVEAANVQTRDLRDILLAPETRLRGTFIDGAEVQ